MVAPESCIYCQKNPPDGREHWFPEWLGRYRGAQRLQERICDPCNQFLGRELDHEMSRSGPQAAARYHLRIEGKHTNWAKANPTFYKSQAAEPPTTATTTFPALPFDPIMEDIPGSDPINRRCARQIVVQRETGELVPVRVPEGINGEWLSKAVKERDLTGGQLVHIVCGGENRTDASPEGDLPRWFRKAVATEFPDAANIAWSVPAGGPTLVTPSSTLYGLSPRYVRALAKIAFHYLLAYDNNVNGSEDEFRPMRGFIYAGEGDWQSFVDLRSRSFMMGEKPHGVCHALMLESSSDNVLHARMKFFRNHPYTAPPIKVRLGKDPFVRSWHVGHLLRLFDSREGDHDGEIVLRPALRHPQDHLWGIKV